MIKYEGLWKKIKNIFRWTCNISDDYGGKYMKIRFILNFDLPLKKKLEGNKYYPQIFLEECVYKLA